jgi:uncharacterized integral membrane protein
VRRLLGRIVYWLAVLAISLVLLVLLVLFFESRDASDLERGQWQAPVPLSLNVLPASGTNAQS